MAHPWFALRHLDRPRATPRRIDGGWRPRSLVLGAEVHEVIAAAAQAGFEARHVAYRRNAWGAPPPPRRVAIGKARVTLVASDEQPVDTITLADSFGWGRLEIVVIPPDTPDDVTRRALTAAADDAAGDDPGDEVLTGAYASHDPVTTRFDHDSGVSLHPPVRDHSDGEQGRLIARALERPAPDDLDVGESPSPG